MIHISKFCREEVILFAKFEPFKTRTHDINGYHQSAYKR